MWYSSSCCSRADVYPAAPKNLGFQRLYDAYRSESTYTRRRRMGEKTAIYSDLHMCRKTRDRREQTGVGALSNGPIVPALITVPHEGCALTLDSVDQN